jgi:hypothetical protein
MNPGQIANRYWYHVQEWPDAKLVHYTFYDGDCVVAVGDCQREDVLPRFQKFVKDQIAAAA